MSLFFTSRAKVFPWLMLATCLFAAGCGGDQPKQKPEAKTEEKVDKASDEPANAQPAVDETPPPRALDLTQNSFMAVDLVESFDNDPEGLLNALGGRTIEISGALTDCGHQLDEETDGGQLIRLGDPFVMFSSGLKCLTKAEKPWADFYRGDLVVVTGRLSEYELVLFDSEVELVGEPSIVTIAAADLATEFSFDADRAFEAYDGWPIKVTGEVLNIAINEQGAANVLLAGNDDIRISCVCSAFEFHRVRDAAPGDQFTAVGAFGDFFASDDAGQGGMIEIYSCTPISIER